MPAYEFLCHHCGYRHTVTLTFKQKDNYCPYCEECGTKMTQVFSPAGVVFKGSGFYRNDSRPAPPKPKPEKKEKKKETTNDL
jgi:putative FmdB family regulatory protein